MQSNVTVANTILAQLGGGRFIAMTGANLFVGCETSLRFKLPRNASGANLVHITLEPSDTYRVQFKNVRGLNIKVVAEVGMVYADQLRAVFEEHTGLRTSL